MPQEDLEDLPGLALPPPGRVRCAKDRRYTVHLSDAEEQALLRIAHARGEKPGRVATLLVRSGAAVLDPARKPLGEAAS